MKWGGPPRQGLAVELGLNPSVVGRIVARHPVPHLLPSTGSPAWWSGPRTGMTSSALDRLLGSTIRRGHCALAADYPSVTQPVNDVSGHDP